MKHLCQLGAAVVLTLVLVMSASAGNMTTGIAGPPAPSADGQIQTPAADSQIDTTIAGQIETGAAGQMDTMVAGQMTTVHSVASHADPAMQLAVTLWQSALWLL
jgi:hypothetical protein